MDKEISKYSHTQRKKTKPTNDPCDVCGKNLYYDGYLTQRIGMMERNGDVSSWKCPFCDSEFDLDDNILYIYGSENEKAIA